MGCSSISVRGLAAITAVCVLLCVGAASASAAPLVWTANANEESVSTIDSVTGRLVGTSIPVGVVPGGSHPVSIAITPNGRRAVVADFESGDVTVIETATRKVVGIQGLPDSKNGEQVAISPDGQTAYITIEGDELVLAIDPETITSEDSGSVGVLRVGSEASAVAFSPDGDHAYFGVAPKAIAVVDTATQRVVGKPIEVGGFPTSIVFAADGETAYVTAEGVKGVQVIDTALGEVVKAIPMATAPTSLAVSPDGKRLYIGSEAPGAVSVAETATDTVLGKSISVPSGVEEIAVAPDGKTAWAAGSAVTRINLANEKAETVPGTGETAALVVAPDQSPSAAFTAPGAIAGTPATFSGAASTDPDGSVVGWDWGFGDGGVGAGVGITHTYRAPGTYSAKLSVVDNEGCGEDVVFTGRTAYCSGAAPAVQAVTAKAPPTVAPIAAPAPPSNNFRFGRLVHNRRNGTVRLQVKLPSAGFVLLVGKKVHAVTRKSKGVQSMWLTIHARIELAKQLKKTLRAPVRIRVTFTPNGGTAKTVGRTLTLQRAPHHQHPRH